MKFNIKIICVTVIEHISILRKEIVGLILLKHFYIDCYKIKLSTKKVINYKKVK